MDFGLKVVKSTDKPQQYLLSLRRGDIYSSLARHGQAGVSALQHATPKNTGITAGDWDYNITKDRNSVSIQWFNTNDNEGVNVAVIIQYGHGTGTGGYVEGIDYINPAMRPIFEQIANDVWKEVTKHG